ncbi:MAG: hypothetical protein JNL58_17635 [Planctomyces sp.]|nr:hypothetical protein [Planctomyces sp.]
MDLVYFISIAGFRGGKVRKRVSDFHQCVYHGCCKYLGESYEKERTGEWKRPALSNSNRERLHVSRSGRFVPPVSCPNSVEIVVSSAVKQRLSKLQGIEFQPVVFERLVDIPLPPIGDASDEAQGLYARTELAEKIAALPNIETYHREIGQYFKILMPQYYDVSDSIDDERPVELQFGRYYGRSSPTIPFSVNLLRRHAMYRQGTTFCLTEEAFELLSPSLDLDYFLIDMFSLMRKATIRPGMGIGFWPESE